MVARERPSLHAFSYFAKNLRNVTKCTATRMQLLVEGNHEIAGYFRVTKFARRAFDWRRDECEADARFFAAIAAQALNRDT